MKEEPILPIHSPTPTNPTIYPPPMPPTTPTKDSPPPKARGIARLTVHIPSSFRKDVSREGKSSTPRWKTFEFRLYYLVIVIGVPLMVWIPVCLSQPSHRNFHLYSPRLKEGWLHGRYVDNSDAQNRAFRNNFSTLCKAALGYILLKSSIRKIASNPLQLLPFNVVLSLAMIVALHGSSALKVFLIMALNYAIPTYFRGSIWTPIITWIFNGAVLFMNVLYSGYPFEDVFPPLAFLDSFRGVYPRWHVIFNITMLRLISFNMDYYWSYWSSEKEPEKELEDKQRSSIPHPREFYSFLNYFAYILYPPLYIGGPIITFNDFIWQHRRPLKIETKFKIMYIVRFVACFMTMEYILHFMYVVAIKDTRAWVGDSPAEIAMIGFWNLIVVWLKLLIPWRFFRAWALLDGIDPPENMVRCMANNYSTFGFWRSWHRSYNLWVIRYIYVPFGGAKNQLLNTLIVFTFVALWHDLTFKLLAWGWLISLFVVPELIASYLLPASKYGKYPWYRHICAIGAIFNILMMMIANLIGFVIGTEAMNFFFHQLFGTWVGLRFMVLCCWCIFVAVQLMFEYREEEQRQGIVRRC